jgi:hypothetical protein
MAPGFDLFILYSKAFIFFVAIVTFKKLSFFIRPNGTTRIGGSPLVPAAWADPDCVLIIDASRIERLETESVRVELAFQNEDDWIKNLVCARIECFENINFLRPDSIISTATS